MQHAWIAAALHPFAEHRRRLRWSRRVFDAYARVFHPAVRYPDDELFDDRRRRPDVDVTWAEVAAFNGRTAHPAMEWASITGSWEFRGNDDQPGCGTTPRPRATCPVSVADPAGRRARAAHDHAGGLLVRPSGTASATPRPPSRPSPCPAGSTGCSRGPVELAAANLADEPAEQSANLWWPADRAWFVATDIDLMTTYVGGSAACIAELLATDGLEAAQVPADQRITWDADTVNPLPLGAPG